MLPCHIISAHVISCNSNTSPQLRINHVLANTSITSDILALAIGWFAEFAGPQIVRPDAREAAAQKPASHQQRWYNRYIYIYNQWMDYIIYHIIMCIYIYICVYYITFISRNMLFKRHDRFAASMDALRQALILAPWNWLRCRKEGGLNRARPKRTNYIHFDMILIGFSGISHPFWDPPILGNLHMDVDMDSGWWFGTFFLCFHTLGIIIPTD